MNTSNIAFNFNLRCYTMGVSAATKQDTTIAGWSSKSVMLVLSVLDSLVIMAFLFIVVYLKCKQAAYIDENDDAVTSLPVGTRK
jgi:hypothetical protein